jgi:xylulokinase
MKTIGIDVGTSGVKTLLMSSQGDVLRTVSKEYPLEIPYPSWTQQNPEDWTNATMHALKELVVGFEDDIVAVSFSGQMHGMVTLDSNDQVLRPAILWNDQRTIQEVNDLLDEFGVLGNQQLTGNIPLTGLTAPKVLWMRRHEPDLFARIAKIMLPKDYLVYSMCGAFVTDVSDVSGTHYYNPSTNEYAQPLLDFLGISTRVLPQIVESETVVGTLSTEWINALHLTQDVAVVIGGGDQAMGAIGVGVVRPGQASLSLGTSGVLFVPTETPVIDTRNHLQSYRDASHHFHVMGVLLNAAGVMKWWVEQILQISDYPSFYQSIDQHHLTDSLYFIPHLTGERFPVNDPLAKGVFYGLGYQHHQNDIGRAVLEGVTLSLKEAFQKVREFQPSITSLRVTGGGARSDIWVQMIADALDVEVIKLETEEGPSYGAAMLAFASVSNQSIVDVSQAMVRQAQHFSPRPEEVAYFNHRYTMFSRIYPALKSLHEEMDPTKV